MIDLSKYTTYNFKGVEYYTLEREDDTLIIGEITTDGKHFAFIASTRGGKTIDEAIQAELDFRSFKKEAIRNKEAILKKFVCEKYYTYKGIAEEGEDRNELHMLALEGEIKGEWKTRKRQVEPLTKKEKKQFKWLSGMNLI